MRAEQPTAHVLGGAITIQLGELIVTMMTPEHARLLATRLERCAQAVAPIFAVPLPRIDGAAEEKIGALVESSEALGAYDTGPSPMYTPEQRGYPAHPAPGPFDKCIDGDVVDVGFNHSSCRQCGARGARALFRNGCPHCQQMTKVR